MGNDASLKEVILMLDKVGWDNGLKYLEKEHNRLEWVQADLFEQGEIDKAKRLSGILLKQTKTLIRLNKLKTEKKGK